MTQEQKKEFLQDGTVLCEHDQESLATEFCHDCSSSFCEGCSVVFHKPPSKRNHKREAYKLTNSDKVLCDHDQEEEAKIHCPVCKSNYCVDCDIIMHRHPTKRNHQRQKIGSGSPALLPTSTAGRSVAAGHMKPMPPSSAARPAHPASTAQAPHSQSPLFMGRYDLRGASHFGGNNEVRKGVDTITSQKVALKFTTDDALFANEVAMLKLLRGEHVVSLVHVHLKKEVEEKHGAQGAANVVVMEMLRETLRERTQKRKMDFMEVRHVTFQIGKCLQFVHSNRVVHCDLKPENFMSDASNAWKLIDLDHSCQIGKPISGHTPMYCAPEAARKTVLCKADPALDIWAFGVIFLELATGMPLFVNTSEDQILETLCSKDFKPPIAKVPDEQARHLLQKILRYDPNERASITEIMRHAYFTGGLDTRQKEGNIMKLSNQLDQIKLDTESILRNIAALRTQLLETSEYVVPRLFMVIPVITGAKEKWTTPNQWGKNTFRLHLVCEHDEGFHMTTHEGYAINDPKPFLRKTAPIVAAICKIFNCIDEAAGNVLPTICIPGIIIEKIEQAGVRPTEFLELLTKVVEDVTDTKGQKLEDALKKVRGQALRELQVFLDKNDPGHAYGRLEKITMPKSGQVRWLCPEHAKSFITPSEEATKSAAQENMLAVHAKPAAPISNSKLAPKPSAIKPHEVSKSLHSPPELTPPADGACKLLVLSTPGTISSSLCVRFAQGIFHEKYDPTKEETYNKEILFEGKKIKIEILDSQNIELFTEHREAITKHTHGFIIAISLGAEENPQHSLSETYLSITRIKETDKVPLLLVGLSDTGTTWERQVSEFAHKHALPFLELNASSSGTSADVDAFNTLLRQITQTPSAPPHKSSGGFIKEGFSKLTRRR